MATKEQKEGLFTRHLTYDGWQMDTLIPPPVNSFYIYKTIQCKFVSWQANFRTRALFYTAPILYFKLPSTITYQCNRQNNILFLPFHQFFNTNGIIMELIYRTRIPKTWAKCRIYKCCPRNIKRIPLLESINRLMLPHHSASNTQLFSFKRECFRQLITPHCTTLFLWFNFNKTTLFISSSMCTSTKRMLGN